MSDQDFLEEIIAERTARNPDFPRMVQEELRLRRAAARESPEDTRPPEADAPEPPSGD